MKETRQIMGMPVTVEICDTTASQTSLDKAFDYFEYVDRTFSTYRRDSEISRINRGEIEESQYSDDMKEVFALAKDTKHRTNGYFDIRTPDQSIDPSGIVKGWAIENAAKLLRSLGHQDLYVEAGGDIQTSGKNSEGKEWRIGIRDPFDRGSIVKVVYPHGKGIATSGTAVRGAHIYDPHAGRPVETSIASLTVIGPNVYEADRFATACFAMGESGVAFIGTLSGFEGYAIDTSGVATMTVGFNDYTYDQGD
jgi:thiamine biosynthesis lipoprotein